jgi:hypothetical protein
MSDLLDELTYDYEDDGVLVRKQLERVVLTGRAWATVLFLYEELDPATRTFRAPKIAVVRFKKWRGGYRKQSSFTVATEAQARQLADVFGAWSRKMGADDEPGPALERDADLDMGAEG